MIVILERSRSRDGPANIARLLVPGSTIGEVSKSFRRPLPSCLIAACINRSRASFVSQSRAKRRSEREYKKR